MSRAIKFCTKRGYQFGELMNFLPFKYEFLDEKPDSVDLKRNIIIFRILSVCAVTIQFVFINYLYFQAFFGNVTDFEFFLMLSMTCFIDLMHFCDWYFLVRFYRGRAVGLINAVHEIMFMNSQVPPMGLELIKFFFSMCATTYSILWLPFLYAIAWYLPGTFKPLYDLTELLAVALHSTESNMAASLRLFIFLLIACSLAHAGCSLATHIIWLSTHLFSIVESVEEMLTSINRLVFIRRILLD